ncbi:MAG TPA: malto-oligosyltrehalose synthase [Pyrinomonadaceae bacterium]|nr:malto-oligosyltrehalose synthase [Pyrinomonadaceae bacterium]
MQARIPLSTYRLQFNQHFTFEQAAALVDYLSELGVGDCYSSPILKARPGSVHGYDIVDHTRINPEIGTEEEFVSFARSLRERGMSVLMDVVPNHMCIAGSENRWWLDLLENGPGSPYARFFDVDWNPPNPSLKDRVLLPILGEQFGRVLDNQEIKISYRGGAFFANYYENSLPIAPRTSTLVLALALEDARARLGESHPDVLEMESIITALKHLPARTDTDPALVRERRREKEVVKRRLSTLVKESGEVRGAVHDALIKINGAKGREQSFDHLEELISQQAYRLSFWRVAADEINYRRFFDINELAAVRVEERTVFNAVHEVVFRLMKQGLVTGLRVDHVDGLHDPEKYLRDLSRECAALLGHNRRATAEGDGASVVDEGDASQRPPCYVVVEKILGHDELLRREWPVYGTTGYEFANLLNGVFVDHSNAPALRELYRDFTGLEVKFDDLLYGCKKLVLRVAMSSELHVLARRLGRIAEQHRWSRDFTLNSLQHALGEVIACFPVYRSYIRPRQTGVSPDDRLHINTAIRAAKRRNPATDASIFDFIASLLLLQDPKGVTREQRAERRDFVLRFQQLTSPVTAKGLEDTAFYRFYPLASLNEVGGEPAIIGIPVERFHERNRDRQENWPHSLSATSTHDSKRSEDVRARINVLSEIPEEWNRALHRWRELNRPRKAQHEGSEVPDANEEYLLYQTLVGTWPLGPVDEGARREYVGRVQEYMNKALKEAKLHMSWISQNEAYEQAVREFVAAILEPGEDNSFVADFEEFQKTTTRAGLLNSLSQTLLKIASPGVPDFYQGTELWSFSLVDPDNRRPVDYELRKSLLASLDEEGRDNAAGLVERLVQRPEDGRVKLYVTTRALNFRKAHRELFEQGDYVPLSATGGRENHVIAFARRRDGEEVLAVASRFFTRHGIARSVNGWVGPDTWRDTALLLPEGSGGGRYRDVFTGAEFNVEGNQAAASLPIARVLERMPVALLERVKETEES